jgi:putative peptidoglycan lipid II flippase
MSEAARAGLFRAGMLVMASSVTTMALGFLKNVLAAYYFGTSGAMDAYVMALLVPDAAMHLAQTGAFNFVPLFAAERVRSEERAWDAAGKMLTYWLALLLAAVAVALLFTPQLVTLVAPGFAGARRAIALDLTRTLLLMAVFVGGARILAVTLHAERRFLAAGVSEGAFQVASTLYLVAFHDRGIEALVWAQVFGGLVQLLVVAASLWTRRHRIRPSFDLASAPVRQMLRLSFPVYLGEWGSKLNLVATRAFASLLPAGAVSALQYALMLVEMVPGVLAGAFTTALFPFLSDEFARRDQRLARESLARALVTMLLVFAPLAAGLWVVANPLVTGLFERGSFDAESTRLTATALRIFAPITVALALNALLGSAFHARRDTSTPMTAGLIRFGSNTVLCAVLVPSLGYEAIALAATVSTYLKLGYLLLFADRLVARADLWYALRTALRIAPAVAAMVLVVEPLAALGSALGMRQTAALAFVAVLGLLGAATYLAALWVFCRPELQHHLALLRQGRRRGPAAGAPPATAPASGLDVPREARV